MCAGAIVLSRIDKVYITTGRESVLSRELIKLMQSTEVMASACTVGKEQAEVHTMWVSVAQDGTGAAAH